jgi:hypothetical protein
MPPSTQLPTWVVDLQAATNAETRAQPWKDVAKDVKEGEADTFDVESEPSGTSKNVV